MIHPLAMSAQLGDQTILQRDIAQTIHQQPLRVYRGVLQRYRLRRSPTGIDWTGIQIMNAAPVTACEPGSDLAEL